VDRKDHTQPRCMPAPRPEPGGNSRRRRRAEALGYHDPHGGTGNRTCDVENERCTWKDRRTCAAGRTRSRLRRREAKRAERQEGNGRSDAKRPPTRNILRRVEATRGGGKPPRTSGFQGAQAETRRTSSWQRGATNSQRPCRESRQGGAKPRRRNRTRQVAASGRRNGGNVGPGVDARAYVGREAQEDGIHERRTPKKVQQTRASRIEASLRRL